MQRLSRLSSLGLIGCIAVAPLPAGAIQVGSQAPDFTLTDLDGVQRSLSQYHGRVVLLGLIGYG